MFTLRTFAYLAQQRLRPLRRGWRWMKRHPRWSSVIFVGIYVVLSESIGFSMSLANADNGSVSSLPWLSALNPKDSQGVDLLHYVTLPLQRGDMMHTDQMAIAGVIDLVWTATIWSASWVLWLFQFLLSFQWVQWLVTPISSMIGFVTGLVTQVGWVPLALGITALVCGVVIMSGRVAVGLTEVAVSVFAAAITATLLLNPFGLVTGPSGVLQVAQDTGGSLAASIASDKPHMVDGGDASQALSSTITSQLMDVWVRDPAQEIAFGKVLTGNCATVFNQAMMGANPIDRGSTSVRDAVAGCDAAAGSYVNSPNFGQVATAWTIFSGVGWLQLLGVATAILLIAAVLYTLFQAAKFAFSCAAAVLPGIARLAMWRSFLGLFVGGVIVGGLVVILSGSLKVLAGFMRALSTAGVSVLAQTFMINLVIIALLGGIIFLWVKAHKAGETLAKRLSRLGFGRGVEKRPNPVTASAMRVGEDMMARRLMTRRANKALPAAAASASEAAAAAEPITLTATRLSGAGAHAAKTAGATKAIAAGGATVATGGTNAVVMTVGKIAGGIVIERAATSALRGKSDGAVRAGDSPSQARPGYTAFGRRIVVDTDGSSRIEPVDAPQRGGVYRITNAPAPRKAGQDSDLRRRLRDAVDSAKAA